MVFHLTRNMQRSTSITHSFLWGKQIRKSKPYKQRQSCPRIYLSSENPDGCLLNNIPHSGCDVGGKESPWQFQLHRYVHRRGKEGNPEEYDVCILYKPQGVFSLSTGIPIITRGRTTVTDGSDHNENLVMDQLPRC